MIDKLNTELENRLSDLGSELLELRTIKSDMEKTIKTTTSEIIDVLETMDSKVFETDDIKVSKQDVSRVVIDNNVAKVVIPKKYLEQIMKTTEFSKVLVKEVQNG
jgi:5'(3')-deoxyribonucleotidase|tara:strand:- start:1936 stop:2250 length:315 start_codon:yes stop_codon:yes gene_type:complete